MTDSELEELRAGLEIERLRERLRLRRETMADQVKSGLYSDMAAAERVAMTTIAYTEARALLARLEAAEGGWLPKVKQLEWHKSHIEPWAGDYHTLPTAYSVRCADENGWTWQGLGAHGYAWSPESAQAEAQRHHEARVLSALLPTPPKPEA